MAKRPRSKLTEKQEAFVEAKMEGKSDIAAAKQAGYKSADTNASSLANVEAVRVQLAAARRWLTDLTQIKRLDVVEGILDGIEIARMQGDAGNVIKGWVEVSKILGYAAPEVKIGTLNINQARVRSKFEALSDAELLAISEGRTVDGEATRVN